jgi:shikimate kinase
LTDEASDVCVLLAGPSGVGKSAVGRALAARLGWSFVDVDEEIERQSGQRIPEIFASSGEAYFRKLESKMIVEFSRNTNSVVATGGGGLLSDFTLRQLSGSSRVVTLRASDSSLISRLSDSNGRPLVGGPGRRMRILNLAAERSYAYDRLPNQVDADSPVEEVAENIRLRISDLKRDRPCPPDDSFAVSGHGSCVVIRGSRSHPKLFEHLRERFDVSDTVLVGDAEDIGRTTTIIRADFMANGFSCKSVDEFGSFIRSEASAMDRNSSVILVGDQFGMVDGRIPRRLQGFRSVTWIPGSLSAVEKLQSLPEFPSLTVVIDPELSR